METRTIEAISERWRGAVSVEVFGSKMVRSAVYDIGILLTEIDMMRDAALEIQPKRLAEIETQMQVSCQAAATVAEREGNPHRAVQEREMITVHKETAQALRRLFDIAGGNDD